MSDGAVRAQRWYLKQRPCRYCCEGCWQIALSRSTSMKNEISASCENSAPQGLRGWVSSGLWEPPEIPWDALGQKQTQVPLQRAPVCPIPGALCMGTQVAIETLIPHKRAGLGSA